MGVQWRAMSATTTIRKRSDRYLDSLRFLAILTITFCSSYAAAAPPFSGTIFLSPDIINSADVSAFKSLVATGQGSRLMFDRREDQFVTINALLFQVDYDDGLSLEVQVNPEFGSDASSTAEFYARVIGQLPLILRTDVNTVWIHKGDKPFGGGNNNLLIHTEQGDKYIADGILEETLFHEASHTSLDPHYANAVDWLQAQGQDAEFISTYARDNPDREDIAESALLYFALRFRSERITTDLLQTIAATIPARIAFFDQLDLMPLEYNRDIARFENNILNIPAMSFAGSHYRIQLSLFDAPTLVFQLLSATVIPASPFAGLSAFADDRLSIPEVAVGAVRYSAELRLISTEPVRLQVSSATELQLAVN